jgi:hypothetical protein
MWAKRANTFIATMLTDPYEGRLQEARVAVVRAKETFRGREGVLTLRKLSRHPPGHAQRC